MQSVLKLWRHRSQFSLLARAILTGQGMVVLPADSELQPGDVARRLSAVGLARDYGVRSGAWWVKAA